MPSTFARCLIASAAAAGALALAATDLTMLPLDHPAIHYAGAAEDPVTRLEQRIAQGKAKLDYRPGLGYLPSLLAALGVNPDSQSLVFSKTSFQAAKISPSNPRALFFNDEVMVGSVRGGDVLELAALDPKQGMVFYTLDAQKSDKPQFVRRDACLQCHQGPATLGIPGLLVGSVFPDPNGMPSSRSNNPVTDDNTPIEKRWGGWYVTGTTGGMNHLGNAVARDPRAPDVLDRRGSQNVTSLAGRFDFTGYIAQTSDIVALMTLEHQTRMVNLMIRAGWDERVNASPATIDADIELLVRYMLFADEATLYDPIEGVSTFAKTFAERGPRDRQGRSLRDFDLHKRMFRYPLSFMLYSPTFDALPDAVREKVYRRIYDVLNGQDQAKFPRLTEDDRKAVLEIVRETKPELPDYWRQQ
ncbi:MAG TPA: hypothetical protein VGG72_34345 [Bryobacteraceae bacterium]|jgi:hypothetical protein